MKGFDGIAILIPAYKPSNELTKLVLELFDRNFSKIVVVDDGSGEESADVFGALPAQAILLRHPHNKGKGRALKTGLAHINDIFQSCSGVITCDADGQHAPDDISKVAECFLESDARSLILGSRTFQGAVPRRSAFGNKITRGVFYLASRVKLRDTQTGLRAFPRHMIPGLLAIPGERYEYEMNMLLELARQQVGMVEVEIRTVYMDGNKSSHFHVIRDSVIIYGNIIRFSLSSLVCFGIDFCLLFIFRFLTDGLSYGSSLLISVTCARVISSFINYCLNRHIVFRKDSRYAIVKYYTLVVCVLGLNYMLIYFFNSLLTLPLFWSKLATELLLFVLSYSVQKKWIFNERCSA